VDLSAARRLSWRDYLRRVLLRDSLKETLLSSPEDYLRRVFLSSQGVSLEENLPSS